MSKSYRCCEQSFESYEGIRTHLEQVHGVDVETQQFTKSMVRHVDGRDWYSTTYRWTCDKVTFIQTVASGREKNDPMRGT
jgi:hypothetical protein